MISPSIQISPYTSTHKQTILDLFALNVPQYFASTEYDDLVHYLSHELEDYFVVKHTTKVIGAGGINYKPAQKQGIISWDLLHPTYQRKGIGSMLLKHRLNLLLANKNIDEIVVRTSQMSYPFYAKFGFKTTKTQKDYWAPSIDLYHMIYSKK